MQEVYQAWSEGHPLDVDEEKDPFWDPPEDFFLGSVFVILQPLAYCIGTPPSPPLLPLSMPASDLCPTSADAASAQRLLPSPPALPGMPLVADINETMSVTNYQGGDEGVLEVALDPCMPDGAPPTEDMFVSSPEEVRGARDPTGNTRTRKRMRVTGGCVQRHVYVWVGECVGGSW